MQYLLIPNKLNLMTYRLNMINNKKKQFQKDKIIHTQYS